MLTPSSSRARTRRRWISCAAIGASTVMTNAPGPDRRRWRGSHRASAGSRDERRGAEQPKSEDKENDVGDGEVSALQQSKVDDRLFPIELPQHGSNPGQHGDGNQRGNEGIAEPVVDLPAVECDFEGGGGDRDQPDSNPVDVQLASRSNGGALGCKRFGI